MSERKWVKGANGLWRSYDPAIAKERLRKAGRQRIAGIRERLAAVLMRNGWTRPMGRWRKPKLSHK